jgi:hypothetical protein
VSALVWFQLRDEPLWGREHHQAYESGLYFRCTRALSCDRPKPSLTAFRFPFVAYRTGARVLVWGRTPAGRRGTVVVEQRVGRTWRRLAALATDRYGIFTASLRPAGAGDERARRGSDSALGFSLRRPPDYPVRPFGTPQ